MSKHLTGNNITDLLLLLCNSNLTEEEKERARLTATEVTDWHSFSDLALRNGVAALVWYNITDCGFQDLVPEEQKKILDGALMRTITRVTFIAVTAADITRVLTEEGIKPLLLKGLALEHTVYGSRGLRQMSDVDILVTPADCFRARDILLKQGFVSQPLKSQLYEKILMFIGNHLPDMHKNGISVDLHHRLFGTKGASVTERGIEEAETIEISGVTCYILPPETAFTGLVMHLRKHDLKGEFQVRLFTDLYLMLKNYGEKILTGDLIREAEEADIAKELATALFLISVFWKFPVPGQFIASMTLADKEIASSRFIEGLKNPGISVSGGLKDLYRSTLNEIPGVLNKLIFLLGDIIPSISFMKKKYNCKTLFCILLHYPYRLGKILWFVRSLISH
jgi:hypothetical protein